MSTVPTGATRLFPIVGDPIRFVGSPAALTRTFAARGADAICIPLQVPADALDPVMAALTATPNVDGILVTMPHKRGAVLHCAELSERARRLQVVNVMRRLADGGGGGGGGGWYGDMTDGLAFVNAQLDHGATVEGRRALLVGAGGAGSAIALALLEAGVAELALLDTDRSRVEELLRTLDAGTRARAASPDGPDGDLDLTPFDLVLNASPLGMREDDPLPVDAGRLTGSTFVGDVISGHGTTPLVAAARAKGCGTATGDDMVEAVQDLMADFFLSSGDPS